MPVDRFCFCLNIAGKQRLEHRSPDMRTATRQRFRLSGGTDLSFLTAGEPCMPAVLLLHGSPSSARMFREVISELSQVAYVIAPDLPGFGESDVLPSPSFPDLGLAIAELRARSLLENRFVEQMNRGDRLLISVL